MFGMFSFNDLHCLRLSAVLFCCCCCWCLFLDDCIPIRSIRAIGHYRSSHLCMFLPSALHDTDTTWSWLFSHYFGMVSIGGHAGFGKQRGIFQGIVFHRWNNNIILFISLYSKFANIYLSLHETINDGKIKRPLAATFQPFLPTSTFPSPISSTTLPTIIASKLPISTITDPANFDTSFNFSIHYIGCYRDDRHTRDLDELIPWITPMTPLRCITACTYLGYQYAGIQWGRECWCGNQYGRLDKAQPQEKCNTGCYKGMDEKLTVWNENGKNTHYNRCNLLSDFIFAQALTTCDFSVSMLIKWLWARVFCCLRNL